MKVWLKFSVMFVFILSNIALAGGLKAYYDKVDSGEEFEKYSRTGPYADIVVTLNNGKKHKFDGSMLPFFKALSQKTLDGSTPQESSIRLPKRYAEKPLTGQTSLIKILVVACIASGIAGLIAGALVSADVFKDEKAPLQVAPIIFAIAALIGFVGRNKYACGECGKSVTHSQHFCPNCKCVFK